MSHHIGFFNQVRTDWSSCTSERSQFARMMPIPTERYKKPYRSIESVSSDLIDLIANPLKLTLNMIGYLLKSIYSLIVSVALVIPAIFAAICAPKSDRSMNITDSFVDYMSQTVVSFGMMAYALAAAIVSLVLNPISVIARTGATVVDRVSDAFKPCLGYKMVNL